MKTKLRIIFTVFGEEFDPAVITEITQIQPSKTHFKGDSIPGRKAGLIYQETAWEFDSADQPCLLLEEILEPFWVKIRPKIPALAAFIQEYGLQSKLFVVSTVYGDDFPGIFFGKSFLADLVRVKGELDIDLYRGEG